MYPKYSYLIQIKAFPGAKPQMIGSNGARHSIGSCRTLRGTGRHFAKFEGYRRSVTKTRMKSFKNFRSIYLLATIILKSYYSSLSIILFESQDLIGLRRCWQIRENLSVPAVESACRRRMTNNDFLNLTAPRIAIDSKDEGRTFNVSIGNATILRQVSYLTLIEEEKQVDTEFVGNTQRLAIYCISHGSKMKISSNIIPSIANTEYRTIYEGYPSVRMFSIAFAVIETLQSGYISCSSIDEQNLQVSAETLRIFILPPGNNYNADSPFVSVRESTVMNAETGNGFVVPCRTNYKLESQPYLLWKSHIEDNFTKVNYEEMTSFRWDPTIGFQFGTSDRIWENEILACKYGSFVKEFGPVPSRFMVSFVVEAEGSKIGCEEVTKNDSSNLLLDSLWIDQKVRYHTCASDIQCDLDWDLGLLALESRSLVAEYSPLSPKQHPMQQFGILSCFVEHGYDDMILPETIHRKYFVGLDSNVYLLPGHFPASSAIRITEVNGTFYKTHTELYHEFTCTLITFVMSESVYLILRYEDESETVHEPKNWFLTERSSENGFNVVLHTNMTHAVCLGFINDGHIMSAERPIRIVDATAPSVDNATSSARNLKVGELNDDQTLVCPITGDPSPNYTWIFDEKNSKLIRGANAKVLTFLYIDEELAGKYTCVASNAYGSTSYDFQVSVQAQGFLSKLSRTTKVGISFGTVLGLIVSCVALMYAWKYHMAKREIRNLTPEEAQEFLSGIPASGEVPSSDGDGTKIALHLPFTKFIEPKSLIVVRDAVLGKGQYGIVYRGVLDGEAVAVKTFKRAVTHDEFRAGLVEVKLISFVGEHPNIVKFIGADVTNIERRELLVVMELSPIGSLEKHLRRLKPSVGPFYSNEVSQYCHTDERPMHMTLFGFCEQIAFAMEHLESKRVIHGDLAARNVLVFSHGMVKVTDFGYSRQLYENNLYQPKKNRALPWRWASIELLRRLEFSTESDIWAFGVTVWEIFTFGNVPFASVKWNDQFMDSLENGVRLKRPSALPKPQYAFLMECWNVEKSVRPRFSQLKNFFSTEKKNLPDSFQCKTMQ